jgi:HD-like signal output (HDOD) protein
VSTQDNRAAEHALIVQQEGTQQRALMRSTTLILNYQYGLDILMAADLSRASALALEYRNSIRCTFIIQNEAIYQKRVLTALSLMDKVPLFILCPLALQGAHLRLSEGMKNAYVCAWERAFSQMDSSLQQLVANAFASNGPGKLLDHTEQIPYEVVQQRTERRLKHINTFPTLPEVVLRLIRLVNDPQTSNQALEEAVSSDPAIVWKFLQVMESPIFSGIGHKGKWTLKEAIARLGRRKVGAIAQQVALINNLVKLEESAFDLRRFWAHSLGCAAIADKLCTQNLVTLKDKLEFNDYWIGALLHDIGKLILGIFFWDWFESVLERMDKDGSSFRQAEARLGDVASHEYLGRLLLLNANMGAELVEVVGAHHDPGDAPGPLICLVHLANNLCKDLGLSCLPDEKAEYSAAVLEALGLQLEDVQQIKEVLGGSVIEEIKELVDRCI